MPLNNNCDPGQYDRIHLKEEQDSNAAKEPKMTRLGCCGLDKVIPSAFCIIRIQPKLNEEVPKAWEVKSRALEKDVGEVAYMRPGRNERRNSRKNSHLSISLQPQNESFLIYTDHVNQEPTRPIHPNVLSLLLQPQNSPVLVHLLQFKSKSTVRIQTGC
ncbi:hypothetical protein WG66_013916 [Moniliophthora roreri]|nr:hypothetical protein WG66_013916 [Moniliophthora roreri]